MNNGKYFLEKENKRNQAIKTRNVVNETLKIVGFAGILGAAVVAPNSLQAIDYFLVKYEKDKRRRQKLAWYLKSQDLLYFKQDKDRLIITLTEKGATRFSKIIVWDYEVEQTSWKGRWYILMFDIPEKYKTLRDMLSKKVQDLNMKPLQDSVYISPYSIDKFVQLLRETYPEAMKHVMYFEATTIEGEHQLKKAFGIKN